MKKNLLIVGAGLMGREVATWARESGFSVKGFLDSRTHILDGFKDYPPILSSVDDYLLQEDDVFVCAIGEPAVRKEYVERVLRKGGEFVSIVHPLSYVGQNTKIGKGCIVGPHATLTNDIAIADHVIINVNSSVSHDCQIGDFVTICPGCHIAGVCKIATGSFLGVHSALIPHITLGDGVGVYVAAGAVVTRSTNSSRIMGVPAREW